MLEIMVDASELPCSATGSAFLDAAHPVDRTQPQSVLDVCRDQPTAAGITPKLPTMLADSGYVSEDNFLRAEQQNRGYSLR